MSNFMKSWSSNTWGNPDSLIFIFFLSDFSNKSVNKPNNKFKKSVAI